MIAKKPPPNPKAPLIRITVEYNGGLDGQLDDNLRSLADLAGLERVGSGCLLEEPFTRDLEWQAHRPHQVVRFVTGVLTTKDLWKKCWISDISDPFNEDHRSGDVARMFKKREAAQKRGARKNARKKKR